MMTNTIKVPLLETRAYAAIERAGAREAQPEPCVLRASSEPDLESRIKQRRVELIGELRETRSEASLEVAQTEDGIKARLSALAHILSVADGWSNLGDTVTHQLERWLAESKRPLCGHDRSTSNGGS